MSEHDTAPTGVLLMAYGTPNSLDEVEPYYIDVRGGRAPTPELLAELKERYRLLRGGKPPPRKSRGPAPGLPRPLDAPTPPPLPGFPRLKHPPPPISPAGRPNRAPP